MSRIARHSIRMVSRESVLTTLEAAALFLRNSINIDIEIKSFILASSRLPPSHLAVNDGPLATERISKTFRCPVGPISFDVLFDSVYFGFK